jgi:hypothetical protein
MRQMAQASLLIQFILAPPVQNLDGLNREQASQINLPPDTTLTPAGMRKADLVVINCFGSNKHCFALEIRRLRCILANATLRPVEMT